MDCITRWGKRLLITSVVIGGVTYCAVTSYQRLKTVKSSVREEEEELRCRGIYVGIQQSCFTTVSDLLGRMNDLVKTQLNTEAITEQLKENPSNKIELWETLKLTSFSSVIVSSCICSMITVLVRVQLSVIASAVCSQGKQMTKDREKRYLLTYFEIFEEGLNELITAIRRSANKVLMSYSLKQMISLEMINQIMTTILTNAAAENRVTSNMWMMQYMLPRQQSTEQIPSDIRDLMIATEDALEIKDTQDIIIQLTDCNLTHFSRSIIESFHSAAQSSPSLPLARVIPLITDHSLLHNVHRNHMKHIQEMVNDIQLMSCSRNIFEAFSKCGL